MYHGVGWADFERVLLTNESRHCPRCGASLVVAYRRVRRVILLRERLALTVQVDRCTDPTCPLASTGLGPPEEARLALPKFTYGLDVVTEIARLRWVRQRSVPEIHAVLRDEYGLPIAERTVDYATETWQELATAWVMHDGERIDALREQGGIVLAIDGLQPEKGHDTVYVLRDTISRQNLLTRPLSNSASRYLVEVIEEVKALGVPILGVVTDKQQSLVLAVEKALPAVPHQLCQFHFLRDLALPVIDADRKLKTTIKKRLRGIAPVERAVAPQLAQAAAADKDASTVTDARTDARTDAPTDAPTDARAEQVAGYCTALRATLTHDGKPPLSPGGLATVDRLTLIDASLLRSIERGGARNWCGYVV